MELIDAWIESYGYFAIYGMLVLGIVGLPIPDETMLTFAGYSIFAGRLDPATTWCVALAGSISGITISYWIGRTAGQAVLLKHGRRVGITQPRINRVHLWFNRAGHWTLTFGYFVAGFRHFAALVAGISRLEFRTFATFAWSGAVLWVTTYLSLGYFLGENWKPVLEQIQKNTRVAVGVALVVLLIGLLVIYAKRERRIKAGHPPGGDRARQQRDHE